MANSTGIDTVPLGEAGTGAAYILPQSQAINQLSDYIDARQQAKQQAEAANIKQAQDLAKSWQDNQLNIKAGTIFQPEINAATQKAMDAGLDLQKGGVNPTQFQTDAGLETKRQNYLSLKDRATQLAQLRDKIAPIADKAHEEIGKQDPGYYSNVDAVNKFTDGSIPLSEIYDKGYQFPALQKAFNEQTEIDSKMTPVKAESSYVLGNKKYDVGGPDVKAHIVQAQQEWNGNPAARAELQKRMGGVSVAALPGTQDVNAIYKDLDEHMLSYPEAAANMGFTSYDSPDYKSSLMDQAKKMANAQKIYDQTITNTAKHADAKVGVKKNWDYDYKVMDEMRSEAREAREKDKFPYELDKLKNDAESASPSYNVEGTVAHPVAIGKPGIMNTVTNPAVLPNINKSMVVNPAWVVDPVTGHFGSNSQPRNVQMGSPALTPIGEVTDANGVVHRQLLNDAEVEHIKSGGFRAADGTPMGVNDLKYRYMINGTEKRNIPVMGKDDDGKPITTGKYKEQTTPISFDAGSVNSKLYNKDINYDEVEKPLDDFVRNRIVRPTNGSNAVKKSATMNQIKNLVGKPGYEGYTADQLSDYYKSLGYDINK